jgi:ABC-type enterochelin transport system permease subunit
VLVFDVNPPFFLDEVNILQGDSFQLSRKSIANVYLSVMTTSLHIVSPDYLVVCAAENIFHENQMIGSLNLVALERKKAINLGKHRLRISSKMLIEVKKV